MDSSGPNCSSKRLADVYFAWVVEVLWIENYAPAHANSGLISDPSNYRLHRYSRQTSTKGTSSEHWTVCGQSSLQNTHLKLVPGSGLAIGFLH